MRELEVRFLITCLATSNFIYTAKTTLVHRLKTALCMYTNTRCTLLVSVETAWK